MKTQKKVPLTEMDEELLIMKTQKKVPLTEMDERELVRINTASFNRGELKNYMLELQDRRRLKKIEMELLESTIRSANLVLSRGSV